MTTSRKIFVVGYVLFMLHQVGVNAAGKTLELYNEAVKALRALSNHLEEENRKALQGGAA